jgi:hypothetical protein
MLQYIAAPKVEIVKCVRDQKESENITNNIFYSIYNSEGGGGNIKNMGSPT